MFLYRYAVNQKETQKRLSSYHSLPNTQLLTPNSQLNHTLPIVCKRLAIVSSRGTSESVSQWHQC